MPHCLSVSLLVIYCIYPAIYIRATQIRRSTDVVRRKRGSLNAKIPLQVETPKDIWLFYFVCIYSSPSSFFIFFLSLSLCIYRQFGAHQHSWKLNLQPLTTSIIIFSWYLILYVMPILCIHGSFIYCLCIIRILILFLAVIITNSFDIILNIPFTFSLLVHFPFTLPYAPFFLLLFFCLLFPFSPTSSLDLSFGSLLSPHPYTVSLSSSPSSLLNTFSKASNSFYGHAFRCHLPLSLVLTMLSPFPFLYFFPSKE